jgi:hypothetical protein
MDVFRRCLALALTACSVTFIVLGVAMFWGPLRQVLAAPVVIVLGMLGYVASRALWLVVKEEPWNAP